MLYKLKTQQIYFKYLPKYFKLTEDNDNINNNVYNANTGHDLITLFQNNRAFN